MGYQKIKLFQINIVENYNRFNNNGLQDDAPCRNDLLNDCNCSFPWGNSIGSGRLDWRFPPKRIDFIYHRHILAHMPGKLSAQKEARIRAEFPKFPFPALTGFKIDKLEYGTARLTVKHRDDLTQGSGYLHGGVISALCDSGVAFALATMIDGGEDMLTVELKINFIAPADDDIFAWPER